MNHPRSRLAYWITRFVNHKRALGFNYKGAEFVLRALCRHVERYGYSDLTAKCFDSWMATYQNHHPNTRSKWYSTVRYFCLYRRRREPDCFLPSSDGVPKRQPIPIPVIVEPEQIARMLPLTSALLPANNSPLRAPVLRLSIVLLYTCGLRIGELIRLTLGDIEDAGTVLSIRDSKFHKSRLVPLSVSAARELKIYLQQRERASDVQPDAPLLCARHRGRSSSRRPVCGTNKAGALASTI
jgi:integrase/recombinase XerD